MAFNIICIFRHLITGNIHDLQWCTLWQQDIEGHCVWNVFLSLTTWSVVRFKAPPIPSGPPYHGKPQTNRQQSWHPCCMVQCKEGRNYPSICIEMWSHQWTHSAPWSSLLWALDSPIWLVGPVAWNGIFPHIEKSSTERWLRMGATKLYSVCHICVLTCVIIKNIDMQHAIIWMKVLTHSFVHRILPPDVLGIPLGCFKAGHEITNEVFHRGFHVLWLGPATLDMSIISCYPGYVFKLPLSICYRPSCHCIIWRIEDECLVFCMQYTYHMHMSYCHNHKPSQSIHKHQHAQKTNIHTYPWLMHHS